MKGEYIKGMAKHIMSEGKHPMPADAEPDADDLGPADTVHVERAGQGYIVHSTHPAAPPYREGQGPEPGEGVKNNLKEVFQEHGKMLGHVAHLMRPH